MKASLLIQARDQASSVFGRIASRAKAMGASFRPVARDAKSADRAIDRIGRGAAERFSRIGARARKMAADFKVAERAGSLLGRTVGGVAGFAAKWASLAAGAGLGAILGGAIAKGSQFEQFQIMLENSEGSAKKAKAAMAWVQEFAKTTPYELDQVMEAFVAMKAFGIDPMDGSLKSLGNSASGMNKQLMQAVEMLADAQTGEFERLKEFGIRASKQGEQISFTYMKAGREIKRTAKNSSADIQRALVGILDERFAGMMERQSKTLAGTWSNLKDMASGFQLDIANAGIFDLIKKKADALLAKFQMWAKDGSLKAWAEQVSTALENMVNWADRFINQTDWKQTGRDMAGVASAAWTGVKALATMVSWALKLKRALDDAAALFVLMNGSAQGKINAAKYFIERDYGGGSRPANRGPAPVAMPGRRDGKKYSLDAMMPVRGNRGGNPTKIGGAVEIRVRTDPGVRTQTKVASINRDVPVRMANTGSVSASS